MFCTEALLTVVVNERSDSHNILMIFAGLPATTTPEGISLTTTLPAPMVTLSPMVTPGSIVTEPPIQTLLPIVTGCAHS